MAAIEGLDSGVVSGTVNANFKTVAETPGLVANTANQNMVANQHAMYLIGQSSVGQIVNRMNTLDPTEAGAISKVTNSGLAQTLASLMVTAAAMRDNQNAGNP